MPYRGLFVKDKFQVQIESILRSPPIIRYPCACICCWPLLPISIWMAGVDHGDMGRRGHVTHCTSGQTKSKTVLLNENKSKLYKTDTRSNVELLFPMLTPTFLSLNFQKWLVPMQMHLNVIKAQLDLRYRDLCRTSFTSTNVKLRLRVDVPLTFTWHSPEPHLNLSWPSSDLPPLTLTRPLPNLD